MESSVVVDTLALVAIVSGEEGAEPLFKRLESFNEKLVAAPSILEAAMVLIGRKQLRAEDLSQFLTLVDAVVVPFELKHAETAVQAFMRYGRGRHPAALNFGDCISYAAAKVADSPLLFVGDDFAATDVAAA